MLKAKVIAIRQEAEDIKSFELAAADDQPLPRSTPGSHIDVQAGAPPGNENRPLLRQYSLCQSPDEDAVYRFAVKRESASRGGSAWLHDVVQVGDLLDIGVPRDNFPPAAGAALHVLLAGGIGITPMVSMAEYFDKTAQPFELHYFARSLQHAAFHDMLRAAPYRGRVHFHFGLSAQDAQSSVGRILANRVSIRSVPSRMALTHVRIGC